MADRAAVLIRQVCASGFGNGSEEYSIVIVERGHEFPVFKVSAPRPPTVEWKSASELDVAPSVAVKPELSAAFAGNIAIRYRIPADLRPDVLAANVNGYRQRVEVEIRAGRATFVGGSVEQNLGSLQAAVDRAREDNDTFSRWARAVGAIDASGR